jgi:hypothetical protein
MNLNSWALIATVLGVLIYIALPVALTVIYLSRLNAALSRNRTRTPGGSDDTH